MGKEKHAACLKECTSKDCKKACGALAPGAKAKAAKTMAEERKKGLVFKKGDLSLLKDAQKARHAEELKHCQACVSAECKANCKATIAAAKKSAKVQQSQKKVKGLGLKTSDLKLLQDAEKRQNREEKMIKAMHAHDAKFLHKGGKSNAVDDVNHVPADDGDGDWAPGMRKSAMAQLKEEQAQAKQTAKEAEEADDNSSY